MILRCAVVAVAYGTGAMASDRSTSVFDGVELAQTQTREDRDNRQEDRQGDRDDRQDTRGECRDAEGAAGAEKRDCKQDARQEGETKG